MERQASEHQAAAYTPHSDRASRNGASAGVSPFHTITGEPFQRCVPPPQEMRGWRWLARLAVSPVVRLEDVPGRGWLLASLSAVVQYIRADAFLWLLLIVLVVAAIDYLVGSRVAKTQGVYSPERAHAGALGKITGVLLVLIVRGVEDWVTNHAPGWLEGIPDSHGALAMIVAMGLLLVDLQSIAKHREALGAAPIPVLGRLLEWAHAALKSKIPKPPKGGE